MLTRVPAGELMDSPRRAPVRRTAEVLYSDTSWRPCLIVAWARYRGGWAALIRWPDGREDWRQFNRRHMRPQASALRACPACGVPKARHLEYFHTHVRIEDVAFDGVLRPDGGALHPSPDRPGLGVEVKWADLEPYRVYGSHQQAPARH